MASVFLSYRRSVSSEIAGRLKELLGRVLGDSNVFLDRTSIPIGDDFRDALRDAIAYCDAVVVLIGPGWAEALNPAGERRLDDENDFVRWEVEAALYERRSVVLLHGGAERPESAKLPPELEPLTTLQAVSVGFDTATALPHVQNALARLGVGGGATGVEPPSWQGGDPSWPFPEVAEGLMCRLAGALWPRLQYALAACGWFPRPPEYAVVRNHLTALAAALEKAEQLEDHADSPRYVPPAGTHHPGAAPGPGDRPARRARMLRTIRQPVWAVSGTARGGDRAAAPQAGLGRASRPVGDVAGLLRRTAEPVVLLGDPGSGKSMTLRQVGRQLIAAGARRLRPPVVVYVRLGTYRAAWGNRPGEVWRLIRRHVGPDLARCLARLADAGRLVVLFDGMDEMERRLYTERVHALSEFAAERQGRVRALFACRTNDFSPEFTHRQLVLREFDRGQVRHYLRLNAPDGVRVGGAVLGPRQLAARLWDDAERRELARIPLTLYLLTHFLRERGAWPRNRPELFDAYVRYLYDRLRDREEAHRFPDLTADAAVAGWARMAFEISRANAGTGGRCVDWARGSGHALAVLECGLACGLLVRDENDVGAFRFFHHQLQEHLTACHLAAHADALRDEEWSGLIDTPRWQETLVNLVSIHPVRSGVVRGLHDSMLAAVVRLEAVAPAPAAPVPEPAAGEPAPAATPVSSEPAPNTESVPAYPLTANEEAVLAERVVLAARLVGARGGRPDVAFAAFADTLRRVFALLAEKGRPTTQVRMLRAWKNCPAVCPSAALEPAVYSDTDWVREQAIQALAESGAADPAVQIGAEMCSGGVLQPGRVRACVAAVSAAGRPRLYLLLGWAVAVRVLQFALTVGLFAAVFYLLFWQWPLHQPLTAFLPWLDRGAAAGLATALILLGAGAATTRRAAFWVRAVTVAAVTGGIAVGIWWLNFDDHTMAGLMYWRILTAVGPMLVVLPGGVWLIGWVAFGVYATPILLAGRWGRVRELLPVMKRQSRVTAAALWKPFKLGLGAFGLMAVLAAVAGAGWVWNQGGEWVERYAPWLGNAAVLAVMVPVGGLIAFGVARAANRRVRAAATAAGGYRPLARLVAIDLLTFRTVRRWVREAGGLRRAAVAVLVAAGRLIAGLGGCLGPPLGCLLALTAVVLVLAAVALGTRQGLLATGVRDDQTSGIFPLLAVLIVGASLLFLLLLALIRTLPPRVTVPTDPTAWESAVRAAKDTPRRQAYLIQQTTHHTLNLFPQDFWNLLVRLENDIGPDPAKSAYAAAWDNVQAILRQAKAETVSLPEPAAPVSPTPEGEPAAAPAENPLASAGPAPTPAPPPARRRARLVALAAAVGLLVVTAAALNWYRASHRTVCIVNGFDEPVDVELQGETVRLEPGRWQSRTVREGRLLARATRGGRAEPWEHEFTFGTADFARPFDWARFVDHRRLFDRDVVVINVEGAAVLEQRAEYQRGPGGDTFARAWRYGSAVEVLPPLDYLLESGPPADADPKDLAQKRGVALLWPPPAAFVRVLPALPVGWRLEIAEKHLDAYPADRSALGPYAALAVAHERGRCREFLAKRFADPDRVVALRWRMAWHEAIVPLDGPDELRAEYDRLLKADPADPVALLLAASLDLSLANRLRRVESALTKLSAPEAHAAKIAALLSLNRYSQAHEAAVQFQTAHPDDIESRHWLCSTAYALGDAYALDECLAEAVKKWPDDDIILAWRLVAAAGPTRETAARAGELLQQEISRREYVARDRGFRPRLPNPRDGEGLVAYLNGSGEQHLKVLTEAGFDPADALLELGWFGQIDFAAQRTPRARAWLLLRASIGEVSQGAAQPNPRWGEAVVAMREERVGFAGVAALLDSSQPPPASAVDDLNLTRLEKAVLVTALAQRHAAWKPIARTGGRWLFQTPFAPRHFLERTWQAAVR